MSTVLDCDYLTEVLANSFYDVFLELGSGYKENIYQKALGIEYNIKNVNYAMEVISSIFYKNQFIGFERADIVIYENNDISCIIELKAQSTSLSKKEFIQLYKYIQNLHTTSGFIVNFMTTPNRITPKNIFDFLEIYKIDNSVLYKMSKEYTFVKVPDIKFL
jgi:GxxExxY protein